MADFRRRTGRVVGNSIEQLGGISVSVYGSGTTDLCTLKANKAGTEAQDNPFETNAYGVWTFFVDVDTLATYDYEVDIVFEKTGYDFSVMNEMYENHSMVGAVSAGGAIVAADFDADTFLYATLDDTPEAKTSAQVRTILGLVIGTNVQAYDAELAALAGLTFADDKIIIGTGAGAVGTIDCTVFAQSLLDDTDAATARTTLGLGTMAVATATDYVAKALFDANTILYATTDNTPLALTLAANTFPARASAGDIAAKTITDFALTVLDDADAATALATLGAAARGVNTDITGLTGLATQNAIQISPFGAGVGNTGEIRFLELAAGGTAYVGFKAPDALAGNVIWVLPATDSTGTQFLVSNGSGVLSWSAGGGGGDVTKVGTPVNNQVGIWTGDGTLEGDANLVWDGTGLTMVGTMFIKEQAAAAADVAAYGQLWVKTATPNTLWFTDDAGTDREVGDIVGPASATDGHLLVADGTSGKKAKDGGAPFANVVEDTTPQLYADLDVNGAGKGLAQGATKVLAVSAGGIISYPTQSACECGLSVDHLHIATATIHFLPFDTEVTDIQGEFNSVRVTGTASGTTANHLIDSAKNFPVLGILVGARVINETDYTVARVTNVADGDLTIDANIMASGETYHVFNSRFTATVDGKYEVILVGEMDNLADNKYLQVGIFKNNAPFSPPIKMETRGANTDSGVVCLVARPTLAAGDIMEFYMYHNVGSTQYVRYNVTHLTITKVL